MNRRQAVTRSSLLLVVLAFGGDLFAQGNADWTEPFPPFRIADNLYYVGSKGLANYLITTPQGHFLINSDLEANVPLIRASVEKLGFKFSDVKILLISHAHWDHDAGSATIKKITGAAYMVMDADVSVVESGGKTDFQYNAPAFLYPPVRVDRVLHDGDEVRLGDTVLVAHLTPGHTKGCTTWTMKVKEAGKTYDVVIVGSPNVNPGYKLVKNALYPQIAEDYERMFRVLKSLPCDVFLGAHGAYFDLEAKYPRMKDGAANPFIDPDGYRKFVAQKEQQFRIALATQRGDTDKKNVQQVLEKYLQSVKTADLTLASQVWWQSQDISVVTPFGRFQGWDSVRDNIYINFLQKAFAERNLEASNLAIQVADDAAWAVFDWTFTAKLADGKPFTSKGWESHVYRKTDRGWAIVHLHYSAPVARP